MASDRKTCIVIAPKLDVHAFAVLHAAAALDDEFIVIDTEEFPGFLKLRTQIGSESFSGELCLDDGRTLDLSAVSSLWWRRPKPPNVEGLVAKSFSKFALNEGRQALFGSLNTLVDKVFNHPGLSSFANQKIAQLSMARSVGLTVPETLVSNDPSAVGAFYERFNGNIIYKLFTSPDEGLYPTRVMQKAELAEVGSTAACPCIFQENVKGEFDIRATIVAGQCFSARIDFYDDPICVDTRLTSKAVTPIELPADIKAKLLSLVRKFGLIYGSIDMRFSPTRGFVFFELNPEGQYLWTEIEAGLPISRAIALFMTSREQF
ncbi:MAG: hypothetical protein E6G97_21775 [Alphaproteobacteria bacterium]|nr:MAG: hypothetical protein E6G97_21775 [Alphaproteobacteria bacterium]